jgi:ketosteroid isomerase-like protein
MRAILLFVLLAPRMLAGQTISDADMRQLVEAEQAFSKLSRERNTPAAFLQFLSDDAVTFGKDPRIGKKHYETQKDDGSSLSWWPVFSEIAMSGDFGVNTGPWELREKKSDARPVAYGQFITVWKKIHGEWKAVLDIGVTHPAPVKKDSFEVASISLKNVQSASTSIMHRVVAEEQKFIREYSTKGPASFQTFLSTDARVFRNQSYPMRKDGVASAMRASAYRYLAGDIAASGDLAYVYGKALAEVKENDKVKTVDANYLRVWKKEDGKTWRIIIDVLTYL